MKIWVTGATGSLGGSVMSALNGHEGDFEVLSPGRLELDLENFNEVSSFVELHKPSHVIHLAAKVYGIAGHQQNPIGSLLSNTKIDCSIFSALEKNPPEWVYYASTVAAYGYPYMSMPLGEDDWLMGLPHDSEFGYAMAKRHALSYLELLHRKSDVKYVYGMTTNLFGLGDRFLDGRGHVVISLLEKAKIAKETGTPLKVWGKGEATRDFLSTSDCAQIILSLINMHAGVVNIASGSEIKISQLAHLISQAFELENDFIFTGENEGISRRVCSIDKLKSFTDKPKQINSLKQLEIEITEYAKKFKI